MRSKVTWRAACFISIFAVAASSARPVCAAAPEGIAETIQFDIKPQPLASALNALALQSHRQILFTPEVVKGKTTRGVQGTLTVEAALAELLTGTGLSSSISADGIILVAQPERADALEEVIVPAQKREERLQDVPVPVTVIKADSLVENNQTRLQDFYTSVPGLTVMPSTSGSGGSFQSVSIRGITTGVYTNPTVGIAVDDVPYGSSTAIGAGGGMVVADIDPADLARIEVLRGPQGTLYGASSMGGLIKYVTVDPSTDATTGRVEANMNGVVNGAELGYGALCSINLPLGDNLALRASGFTRQDPGYIDNVQTGQTGINEDRVSGGRIAALWRPSPSLSLKVSALYQD